MLDKVKDELLKGEDDLTNWIKANERVFQQTPFLEVELVTGLPKMDINRWGPSFLWLSSLEKVFRETCLSRLNKQVSFGIML